jgi:hypothetical protein
VADITFLPTLAGFLYLAGGWSWSIVNHFDAYSLTPSLRLVMPSWALASAS